MLEFSLLICRKEKAYFLNLESLCPEKSTLATYFTPGQEPHIACQVYFSPTHPHEDPCSRHVTDLTGAFRLLRGYPVSSNGKPIDNVSAFDPEQEYLGDYFYLSISSKGSIEVRKSKICSYQLYHAKHPDFDVLSSRQSMCASHLASAKQPQESGVSAAFARESCSYGLALSDASSLNQIRNVLNCHNNNATTLPLPSATLLDIVSKWNT